MNSISTTTSLQSADSIDCISNTASEALQATIHSGHTGTQRWPVGILGVVFDAVTTDEALQHIANLVEVGKPSYVVTPNVDFLARADRDPTLRRILLDANLVLCDGMPLVWASRWLGNPLPERVSGADLTPELLHQAERLGHSIFLLGASPKSNSRAVSRIRKRYPALKLAGHYAPPFKPLDQMDHADIIRRVRKASPDIVLVSFGCPKQEKWMARYYREIGAPVCIGVGAVIDFLAGHVRRAPSWMRRFGLEWAYRLYQEPRRLAGRYFNDIHFFAPAIMAECWRSRSWFRSEEIDSRVRVSMSSDQVLRITISGRLDRSAIETASGAWMRIFGANTHCVVDLSKTLNIDSAGIGALLHCRRVLRHRGFQMRLQNPSVSVQEALERTGLESILEVSTAVAPEVVDQVEQAHTHAA